MGTARYLLEVSLGDGEVKRFLLHANEVFPFLRGHFVACDDMLRKIERFEMDQTITNRPARIYALLSHMNRLNTDVYYRGIVRGGEDHG